jgi:outer membrane protein TolC
VPSILNGTVQSLVFSLPQNQYIRAARAGIDAAKLSLKDTREQVALDASTAYIELDTVDRELEAARQEEGFADRLLTVEQERTEAGVDSLNELLQVRLTAAQLKLKRLHSGDARRDALKADCRADWLARWFDYPGPGQHSGGSGGEGK